jgi:SIR2-like domain
MGRQVRWPRLLVILGAGSTIHAGAPSTNAITDLVCQIEDEPIRAVVSRLRDQRTKGNFNFETVLAALEELDEFQLRQRVPTAWQRHGGNLSAFAEFLPQFANLGQDSFLIARARLVGRIKNFVMERTANASPAALKEFFDQLRAEFDLTVLTLNYDDIIDRAGEWYDGFNLPTASDQFGKFDFSGFSGQSAQHPAVLLHLHGSVRFDFPPWGYPSSQTAEIVRHTTPVLGIGTTLSPPDGIAPSPIVAGEGKDRWMTRACIPFGYYYNAFVRTLHTCPRLLIAGYGAADLHVNSWLEDHHRVHGFNKRMVLINNAPEIQTQHIPRALVFGGVDGNFPLQDPQQIREIIGGFKSA